MTSSSAAGDGPAQQAEPVPRVLCDARALASQPPLPSGVLWKLAEGGRQLDANVVRLAPGGRIAAHTEARLDVLLLVVAGSGVLGAGPAGSPCPVAEGALVWLPHGSARGITAGDEGLTYLTVHTRRPGLGITARPDDGPARPAPAPAGPDAVPTARNDPVRSEVDP
ncbi:cupin domain-containing protein [Streptomyces misionensis]|uniref:cupin domain-containing protein n=1 Tax=Streptomyces misionensis TaxID=67331 RepID=UPI0038205E7A